VIDKISVQYNQMKILKRLLSLNYQTMSGP